MDKKSQIEKINNSCKNYKYVYNKGKSKFSKLGNWLEKESSIFKGETDNVIYNKPNFKRGEIIKVDFGVNMGSELSNTHFAIVLNADDNNSVDNITVIPLTSKNGYKRLEVGNILKDYDKENKYKGIGYAIITQVTTISKKRIFNTGIKSFCDKNTMNKILDAIHNYYAK